MQAQTVSPLEYTIFAFRMNALKIRFVPDHFTNEGRVKLSLFYRSQCVQPEDVAFPRL